MKIFRAVERVQNELDEMLCNLCGRPSKKDEQGYFEEFVEVQQQWGYNSEFDGETHSLDICPECYKKIVAGCKIPVTKICRF